MIKLLSIIGTRPQIIKAAAMHRAILHYKDQLHHTLIYTGQHYDKELSSELFEELELPSPNYKLFLKANTNKERLEEMNLHCQNILKQKSFDYVLAYGDTDTTLAATKASITSQTPLIHIEAGMRSNNMEMPEEYNRIFCDQHACLHFTASNSAWRNLISEGIQNPHHVGDVMYDNFLHYNKVKEPTRSGARRSQSALLNKLELDAQDFGIFTLHRNYNTDQSKNLVFIIASLNQYTRENKFHCIFPIHPRTKSKLESKDYALLFKAVKNNPFIHLTDPLPYLEMISLLKKARLVMTDSGGLQKEAYFARKACVILRSETEWTEIVETGSAKLAHGSEEIILKVIKEMHDLENLNFSPIFGDGNAADYICQEIIKAHQSNNS